MKETTTEPTFTREQKLEIRKDFVARLRSGKYQQGHSVLRSAEDKFCCLGVLCESLRNQVPDLLPAVAWDNCWSYAGATHGLPPIAVKLTGMRGSLGECHGVPTSCGYFTTLAHANDAGVPFSEIADIIERYAMDLFDDAPEANK